MFHLVQNAQKDEEYSSISDVDALLLIAGDPMGEDEPIRKGTAFQVSSSLVLYFKFLGPTHHLVKTWLLGFEFPSTFLLFQKNQLVILCSASKGTNVYVRTVLTVR